MKECEVFIKKKAVNQSIYSLFIVVDSVVCGVGGKLYSSCNP